MTRGRSPRCSPADRRPGNAGTPRRSPATTRTTPSPRVRCRAASRGARRIHLVYSSWFGSFPDLAFTSRELLIDGHRVAEVYEVTGTQSAAFGGVPATGRRVEFKGVWLYTLSAEGTIVADERLYDVTNVLVQLGVLRTKPVEKI